MSIEPHAEQPSDMKENTRLGHIYVIVINLNCKEA